MKRLLYKTWLSMGALFDMAPRERSASRMRLTEMRKKMHANRDSYAIQRDFTQVGQHLTSAMASYGKEPT